jgi:Xaa-Pro aminopeptidase
MTYRPRSSTVFLLGALAALVFPALAASQISVQEHAARRSALAARVGDGVILAMGSAAPPQDYIPFFQNSLFRYLTGFTEPDAALLMVVQGGRVEETLFVNPRDPGRETWEGYRVGPEGSQAATGIQGRSGVELDAVMDSILGRYDRVRVVGAWQPRAVLQNDITQRIERLIERHPGVVLEPINAQVNALRAIKSPAELELLERSVAITVAAHREVAGLLAPGMNEFEIQAVVEYTFRRNGAERPAFASIVGSGPNSTVLHYNANDRFMEDGDLMVVDIGASYGGYAADVTRTYPVNGRFSPEQRELYQIVRDAQAAAEALARPGVRSSEMSAAASAVLAEGLARLGLIESPDATYETGSGRAPQLRLFYMHGLGHGIGLDVHDPNPDPLEPGAFISIEPGVYVRPNLLREVIPDTPENRRVIAAIGPAFERFKGIGVRIEDDYRITETGAVWVSPAPREIHEIEALMAEPWSGAPRNAEWVEWFRRMR